MYHVQILVQHIRAVLPSLKSRINSQLVAVAKEHAAYGDVAESKVLSISWCNTYLLYWFLLLHFLYKMLLLVRNPSWGSQTASLRHGEDQ